MIKRLLIISAVLMTLVIGLFFYLYKAEFWSEQNRALRKLESLEIPASALEVKTAVAEKDRDTLRLLKESGVDFNNTGTINEEGDSVLHVAVKNKDWETVHDLIKSGVDLNFLDAKQMPVTHYVLEAGKLELADEILFNGADPNFLHSSGEQALIHYLESKELKKAQLLINHGADPNALSSENKSALFIAIERDHHEVRDVLLEAGADPNGKAPSGEPIFPYFCKVLPNMNLSAEEEATFIERFLDHGVDLNATDSSGWRALQWLIYNDKILQAELILQKDTNVTDALWVALKKKNYAMVRRLLELKADPNQMSKEGDTPLIEMVRENKSDLVTELLNYGADPERKGKEGQSALITAIALKHTEPALTLLSHPKNAADHSAIMAHPVTEEFRVLFGKKGYFDWYCRNTKGLTPLMAAVMMKELEVADKIIENGADKFQGTDTRYKVYPIQMAANNKDVKMQQLLIGVPYEDDQQERNFIIDLSEQKVRYYKNGELIKTSRVSSGQSGFRTPTGNYVITDRTRHKKSNIYDQAPMPYFQRFSCSAIGFHEGNTYSRFASHGCIRLPASTARYFWGEAKVGDRVEIVK